jgi:hypothetical protein
LKRLTAQPGFATGTLGICVLLQLAALRWLMKADAERIYLWGQPLNATCSFRRSFGLPCPTCGMSRSVLLALTGEWPLAWQINPAGLLLVVGLAVLGVFLLVLMCCQQRGRSRMAQRVALAIRFWCLSCGGLAIVALVTHWIRQIT